MSGIGVSRTARGLASLLLAMLFAGAMSVFWLTVSAPSASAATVTDPVEIVDPTAQSSGDGWSWDPAGSAGTLTLEGANIQVADMKEANAAIVVPDGATVATTGSSEGLVVMGSTNIADVAQVKLGTENATPGDSLAANFTGDVTISGTEVIVSGSGVEFWSTAALVGSEVTMDVDTSGAIHAMKGLEITGGSNVSASSSGHVIEILGDMLVQGSTLRVEGVGIWDTAITVTDGNLTVDGSSVTALGDSTESTKGISLNVIRKGSLAGNLILKGAPSLTIEGTDVAIQFVSQAEDLQGNHVVIGDPNIGAVEGGMLTYAERDFGTDFLGVWTYSTGERVSVLEHVLYGAEIQIGAQPDNGYRFVKWEVVGAAPEWENGDAAKAEQMVTIVGQATMTPTVEAAAPADPGSWDPGKDSGKGSGKTGLAASGDSADGVVAIAAIAAGIGAAAAAGAAAKRRSRR